jgi:glycosyltransferase involved in cell wall biosynthesis
MKKIGILVTNLAGTGAEKIALQQAKMLSEKGHEVILFLLENVVAYDIRDCQFKIIALTPYKNMFKPFGKLGDYIYKLILEFKIKQLGFQPDVFFSHLPRADRVTKLLQHPYKFFIIHMSYKAELEKFKTSWTKNKKLRLYRYLYKNEKILPVAKAIQKEFDKLAICYSQATTIYNPFDFDLIRQKASEPIDISYDYIISPSAFREQKRYDIMLDAFQQVKTKIKLVILASPEDKLLQMISDRNLSDKVLVLGFQKNPYKYIKNAKLLILSSDREGLPTVLIESLILNTPVVSTNCPTGPSEILVNGLEKWLVPVGNSGELAKKIDSALNTEIKINESHVEKFNQNFIYTQYQSLFNDSAKVSK